VAGALRHSEVPELQRLGSTINSLGRRAAAYFDAGGISSGLTEEMNLPIKRGRENRSRLPQLRQLPPRLLLHAASTGTLHNHHNSEAGSTLGYGEPAYWRGPAMLPRPPTSTGLNLSASTLSSRSFPRP
jgi:hypothetical protein